VANPHATENDVREGGNVLDAYCSICHGRPGKPGRAPDLAHGILRHGTRDRTLFQNIRSGIPGTQMAGFPDIDDKTVWQVVASIRSRRKPAPLPAGDRDRGHALFLKHSCTTCHWNGRDGGRRGPDLTTSYVPVDYVRTSLVDPDANLRDEPNFEHEKFQQFVAVTLRGEPLVGRWLNDNGRYFLFMDQDDRLHALRKDELEEFRKPRQSLMPSFQAVMTDDDINDLIVYLFSIRPAPKEDELP
jgi:putative heme-binding domain-containing protein